MIASAMVFLDFNLPNATTWFYFSFLLAVALFFKFSRLLSMRNWDVILMFLLIPGLLLIQGNRPGVTPLREHPAIKIVALLGQAAEPGINSLGALEGLAETTFSTIPWFWIGYLSLLCGSIYFFIRCLLDLALVQRPARAPNLSFGGLAWLAGTLFICLLVVAYRQPDPGKELLLRHSTGVESVNTPVGRESATLVIAQELAQQWFSLPPWMTRSFAVLCHLAVILGLIIVSRRHFHDIHAGMAAATFYLMLPYTFLYVSQLHHVLPMALVVWALAVYRYPALAGALLGVAAGTVYFPALLFPIWLSFYWQRGAGRFALAFLLLAMLCLVSLGLDLLFQGELENSIRDVLAQNAWQPWKVPTTEGFWTGVHWAYRIPIFLAYLAFVLATACWPFPKNLAQVIALSAAVLIGIQFWYADQGGVYVLWYLPLLILMAFRPNLAERRPDPIQPEQDWLFSLINSCKRFLNWIFQRLVGRREEPAKN